MPFGSTLINGVPWGYPGRHPGVPGGDVRSAQASEVLEFTWGTPWGAPLGTRGGTLGVPRGTLGGTLGGTPVWPPREYPNNPKA